jgi:6-phosphofructokinase 1
MKTLGILVGGGPAPGINAVISAATIEARNHGLKVIGFYDGFKGLVAGDTAQFTELEIAEVSRIHFDGGSILRTSRENPTKSREALQNVIKSLIRLEVSLLLTIGGDDTAYAASRVAEELGNKLALAHVPKTIDNDLPLPHGAVTFGFTTACDVGMNLVRNLMEDAAATKRWFFVTVMGRRAGHLALGIGGAAGATLTVIPEEFADSRIPLETLCNILEGAIIKRRAHGRDHGVAMLSEGLVEKLDLGTFGDVEHDSYGNVRVSELELAQVLKERVKRSFSGRSMEITIVSKDLGYELRCAPPGSYDIQYCRSLGYWAARFLMEGGTGAMVSIQEGKLVPIPFREMIDPKTGKVRVRYVDIHSDSYKTLDAYMIRLKPEDLRNPEARRALLVAAKMSEQEFMKRFGSLFPGEDDQARRILMER